MTLGAAANGVASPHRAALAEPLPHVPKLAGATRMEGNAAVAHGPGPAGESTQGEGVNAFRSS